jgi:hypothetical protein
MRKPTLLLLPLCLACGEADGADRSVIEGFRDRATPLVCDPLHLGLEPAATEIRLSSDTTWTLLDGPQLQLLSFDDSFRLLDRTPLPATGPGAAVHAVSATLLGDTAVAVAARGGLQLVVLARDGSFRASTPLDFIPNAIAATPAGEILVTPLPFGTKPATLLMRHSALGWETLPVPRRSYVDMSINAIGNSTLVEVFPDGRALVMHQFLRPRAFIVSPDGGVEQPRAPTPDGTRDHVDFVPTSPITSEQMERTLVPAIAMSIDPRSSEVYLMTRSGTTVEGRPERAILRLSERLEFIEGFTLPIPAAGMVYLPRRHSALVVDDTDRFHTCAFPQAGGPA